MTLPALIIGVLISTLYGVLFHLWRGGNLTRLVFYIFLAWAGFWLGQFVGDRFGWTFASFGPIHLGAASVIAAIFLFAGYWLSLVQVERR